MILNEDSRKTEMLNKSQENEKDSTLNSSGGSSEDIKGGITTSRQPLSGCLWIYVLCMTQWDGHKK